MIRIYYKANISYDKNKYSGKYLSMKKNTTYKVKTTKTTAVAILQKLVINKKTFPNRFLICFRVFIYFFHLHADLTVLPRIKEKHSIYNLY